MSSLACLGRERRAGMPIRSLGPRPGWDLPHVVRDSLGSPRVPIWRTRHALVCPDPRLLGWNQTMFVLVNPCPRLGHILSSTFSLGSFPVQCRGSGCDYWSDTHESKGHVSLYTTVLPAPNTVLMNKRESKSKYS